MKQPCSVKLTIAQTAERLACESTDLSSCGTSSEGYFQIIAEQVVRFGVFGQVVMCDFKKMHDVGS